nr:MAG TPA: hypothetical protein [Caudoviricetes sp.]
MTLRCKPCITRQGRHSVDHCFQFARFFRAFFLR